jgi:hypothetical protein
MMKRSVGGRLAAALFLVFVACAGTSDDSTESGESLLGSTELAVVQPANLPGDLGSRLTKTCTATLNPQVEAMLFGKAGAPAAMKAPARVIPPGDGRPLRVKAGAVDLSGPSASSKDPANVDKTAKLSASEMANGANVLRSADGTMEVSTKLRGTQAVAAKATEGLVVYAGGHSDGDVVVRPTGDGAEDWLLLTKAPASGKVEYELGLTKGVKAVRVVANTVEMLDDDGAPRLRMAPPQIVGDDCQRVQATVTVTGCVVDTDPSFPEGKPHPKPNASSCNVALTWNPSSVKYPAAVDPTWSSTASMSVPRAWHKAIKLDGSPDRVLVAGGLTSTGYVVNASAEIYNASNGSWSATGSMAQARYSHGAVKFGDGTVYVAGGLAGWVTASVESYSPSTGTWTTRAPLPVAVSGLSMDLVGTDYFLVAGGLADIGGALKSTTASALYYRPLNYYPASPAMPAARAWQGSVTTPDGVYLLGGERNNTGTSVALNDVLRFNSSTSTFTTVASMPNARSRFGATYIPATNQIFVAGGWTESGETAATATMVVPAASSWVAGPSMAVGRSWGALAVRSTGPLVIGGATGSTSQASSTFFDNLQVAFPGPNMLAGRYAHSATALSNEKWSRVVDQGLIKRRPPPGESCSSCAA